MFLLEGPSCVSDRTAFLSVTALIKWLGVFPHMNVILNSAIMMESLQQSPVPLVVETVSTDV